jgi:UDP-N-acetylmuramate-alanine ligase
MAFQLLVEEVPKNGLVVIDGDRESTEYLKQYAISKVVTYGFDPKNHIRAENLKINYEKESRSSSYFFKQ